MDSTDMKLRIGLAVAAACVFGVIFFRYHSASNAHQSDERTSQASVLMPSSASSNVNVPTANDGVGQQYQAASFIPITGGKPRARASMDPFFRVPKTRNGLPLDDDYFVAESPQEQRWLDRNGYPNTQQMTAYSAAPDIVLEQAAARGDSVAEVMLAARQLAHEDPKAAGKLMTAGMNGSSYALSTLASYLASGKHGNPELGYAVSRVVELRGDWRAAITRDFMFRTPLTSMQKAQAEAEAIRMLDSFREHSRVQPYVDPRPRRPQTKDDPRKR